MRWRGFVWNSLVQAFWECGWNQTMHMSATNAIQQLMRLQRMCWWGWVSWSITLVIKSQVRYSIWRFCCRHFTLIPTISTWWVDGSFSTFDNVLNGFIFMSRRNALSLKGPIGYFLLWRNTTSITNILLWLSCAASASGPRNLLCTWPPFLIHKVIFASNSAYIRTWFLSNFSELISENFIQLRLHLLSSWKKYFKTKTGLKDYIIAPNVNSSTSTTCAIISTICAIISTICAITSTVCAITSITCAIFLSVPEVSDW